MRELRAEYPRELSPPLLILISGVPLSGKSTLAKFMYQHLNLDSDETKAKLVSTNSVLELMQKKVSAQDDPLLHVEPFQCWNVVDEMDKDTSYMISGYLKQCQKV